jgi:hypothetical protein
LLLEGPDLEELLARVRAEHGPEARIVSADRLRRGGVGGFFSKQWFELGVEVPDPSAAPSDPAPPLDSVEALLALADQADGMPAFGTVLAAAESPVDSPEQIAAMQRAALTSIPSPSPEPEAPAVADLAAVIAAALAETAATDPAVLAAPAPATLAAPASVAFAAQAATLAAQAAPVVAPVAEPRVIKPLPRLLAPAAPPTNDARAAAVARAREAAKATTAARRTQSEPAPKATTRKPTAKPAPKTAAKTSAQPRTTKPATAKAAPADGDATKQTPARPVAAKGKATKRTPAAPVTAKPKTAQPSATEPKTAATPAAAAPNTATPAAAAPKLAKRAAATPAVAEPSPATPSRAAANSAAATPALAKPATLRVSSRVEDRPARVAVGDVLVAMPGRVTVVTGALPQAMAVAERVIARLRLAPSSLLVAGPAEAGRERRVYGPEHAATIADELRSGGPVVVAVDAPVDVADGAAWAAAIAEALGADALVAVVEATRRTDDLRRHLSELGTVTTVAVHGTTTDDVADLGYPVLED